MPESYTFAVADVYEQYIGRWSRPIAAEFVDWLVVPPGSNWLDVGCGTGALTQLILQRANPSAVTGIDLSAGFVEHARKQVQDARVHFEVGNAMSLPFDDRSFDAVVSGLALNFMPDPAVALAGMVRVARAGGTVGVYVWDYAERMQMINLFWKVAAELDSAAAELDEAVRFPLCRAGALTELFAGAGLTGVEERGIEITTRFRDFDDYWQPFLGGQGPAPGYITTLSDEHKAALRERLRARLPVEPDGSIALAARVWAAKGTP